MKLRKFILTTLIACAITSEAYAQSTSGAIEQLPIRTLSHVIGHDSGSFVGREPVTDFVKTGTTSPTSGNVATWGTSSNLIIDSGKALPSGAIVGTTDTQTLPNKTLPSPAISSPTVTGTGTYSGTSNFTGPLLATTFQLGTAQTNVGQLGQITAPYTSSGLNTTTDIFRVQVGSIDPTFELGNHGASTAAITCTLGIPSGSYSGPATWPDACGAFYAINGNTTKSAVGLYSLGGISVSGASAYGGNSVSVNCAGFSAGCTGTTGLDFTTLYTHEFDTNIYSKSGVAPAGNAAGVISILNATIQNTGSLSAFQTSHTGTIPWKTAFATNHGDAALGISLGAAANSPSSNSQAINLVALNGSSVAQTGTIFTDSVGTLNMQVPNTTLQLAQTYPYMTLNQTVTGAAGAKLLNASTNASATENLLVQSGSYYGSLQATSAGAFSIQTSAATNLQLVPGTGAYVVVGGKNTIVSAWPTSCSGLVSGSLYSNSGVINVCP